MIMSETKTMNEMKIKFETVTGEGKRVTREFKKVDEMKKEWYSNNRTFPMPNDEIIYVEIDGFVFHYPKYFKDLIKKLGFEEKKNIV